MRRSLVMVLLVAVMLGACGGGDTDAAAKTTTTQRALATATTRPAPTTTNDDRANVTVVEGEPYRQPVDSDPSTVDIYYSSDTPGSPAVVLLHGWGPARTPGPDIDISSLAEEIASFGATVFYFKWDTNGGYSAESAADLSCIGGFVAARAAEHGADPESVIVVGHSMGAATGSMLAFTSFGPAPADDCVETGAGPTPLAFLGVAGAYGLTTEPLDDDLSRFRARRAPIGSMKELAADEFVTPGLTALELYNLDGYGALSAANPVRVVLLVGSGDRTAANEPVTVRFSEALDQRGIDHELIIVPDASHRDVVSPGTAAGQVSLRVVSEFLSIAP